MAGSKGWPYDPPVPRDDDVIPFSMISPSRPREGRGNKKHHYLSVVYMGGFADASGKVWAYHAERPEEPHAVQPASIGYRTHYYSQLDEKQQRDNTSWEDLWSCIETVWLTTVAAVRARRLSPAISFNILGMVGMLQARVPAARDRQELLLAHKLRAEVQAYEQIGALPEEYRIYAGRLDAVPIGINPEQSLARMRDDLKASGDLAFRMGFEVLHNRTGLPFLTSDNPVCFYDPQEPLHSRSPYKDDGETELLFPIAPDMLLRGSTRLGPVNRLLRHRNLSDKARARQFNRTIAQFGYRLYVARDRTSDHLVRQYAASVPTIDVEISYDGRRPTIAWRPIFAPRPILSAYIDTPEKAARLTQQMEREGFFDRTEPCKDAKI